MNVVLLGFMGTGKSVVGAALARELNYHFIDLDFMIETETGCSVVELFQRRGEAYFRDLESDELAKALSGEGRVIAAGGGVLLRQKNYDLIEKKSFPVCLTATVEALLKRLAEDSSRPLLQGEDSLETRLRRLLDERKALYAAIPCQIDTSKRSVAEVVACVKQRVLEKKE